MVGISDFRILDLSDDRVVFSFFGTVDEAKRIHDLLFKAPPTVTIDIVQIAANDSLLNDELLAQRLGRLIIDSNDINLPLMVPCQKNTEIATTDVMCGIYPKELEDRSKALCCADDNNCQPCSIYFDLNVTNDTNEDMEITQQMLTGEYTDLLYQDEPILLTYLPGGGNIQLRALAVKSTGETHTKWITVTKVVYNAKSEPDVLLRQSWEFDVKTNGRLTASNTLGAAIAAL